MENQQPTTEIRLPPGFRFHPSDEEIIQHYLRNKFTSSPLPASIIAEIDLYKYNPWELPSLYLAPCNYISVFFFFFSSLYSWHIDSELLSEYHCFFFFLTEKALFGEDEWYFFTPRDRKYPNGVRPNRAAGLGYWKATGTDKPILTSCGTKSIGVKKPLVFYKGRPP